MITYQLVHEHNEALIDASHQSALLSLESCRRLSHYSLASLRDILNQGGTANAPLRWWHSGLPVIAFGSRSLHEYGYFLEVSGETYARWTDLCEEQWQRAHGRVHAAIANVAHHAPAETGLSGELATDASTAAIGVIDEAGKPEWSETVKTIAAQPGDGDQAKKIDAPKRSRKARPSRNA